MVIDNGLMNVFTVYAAHSGKPKEEKENFWNELFHLVSCMLEVIMLATMERMVVKDLELGIQMEGRVNWWMR